MKGLGDSIALNYVRDRTVCWLKVIAPNLIKPPISEMIGHPPVEIRPALHVGGSFIRGAA